MSDLHVLLFNASVVTAIIGAIAAVAKIWHSSLDRRRLAVNALFAELAHVTRHYEISAGELSDPEDVATLLRRLKWSKYGPVSGSSHLQDLAILGPQQMAEFLQLSFVIRNTDIFIDELLAAASVPTNTQIDELTRRMRNVAHHAAGLEGFIQQRAKRLAPIRWG